MNCKSFPCELYTLTASNGDPLLLYGRDSEGWLFLWPMPQIAEHRIAFARWCKQHVSEFKGCRVQILHPLCEATQRWALWLGVVFQGDKACLP